MMIFIKNIQEFDPHMLKDILKKSELITESYRKVRYIFNNTLVKISPILATKYFYKKNTGRKLNLVDPKDFNEKINWLKLYWQHPLVVKCGDKFEVRNYAEENGCADVLIKSYGIFNNAQEIKWDELPDKFVIKVTNGCGYNIICDDKNNLNKRQTEKQLNKWLKTNYSARRAEIHYSKMTSRIIIEEYIETNDGTLPIDYKIYCFNGVPEYILVTPDRENGFKRYLFDLNWNFVDFDKTNNKEQEGTVDRPSSLDEMLNYSKILAEPFPFVRMDFYDYNGKAILGEMTFTPAAGMATHYKEDFLLELGNKIKLPEKILNGW